MFGMLINKEARLFIRLWGSRGSNWPKRASDELCCPLLKQNHISDLNALSETSKTATSFFICRIIHSFKKTQCCNLFCKINWLPTRIRGSILFLNYPKLLKMWKCRARCMCFVSIRRPKYLWEENSVWVFSSPGHFLLSHFREKHKAEHFILKMLRLL